MPSSKVPDEPNATFLDRPARFEILHGLAAESDDVLPQDNERYRFEGLIGRGGSAQVFRAHDLVLDRPVALKLFQRSHRDLSERRLREARSQARVRHDDVLPIYETGELGGRPFLAMPLVDGFSLAHLPPEVSLEETVQLLARVARALHAAHREGLIHRDVKPSNVLVERTKDGELKPYVADFGISADVRDPEPEDSSDDDTTTRRREIAGTPAYMAPEQRVGERVDRRTDVFGLGATIYHVLTGHRPFVEPQRARLRGGALPPREPAPRPRQVRPDLPVELEAIILRAMADDPAQRYATAQAVAEDLEHYLAGEVVSAHAAGWAYRVSKLVLRHRWVAVLVALASLVALGALTAAAVSGVREAAAHERAASRQARAEELLSFLLGDLRDQLEPLGKLDLLDGVSAEAEKYFRALPAEELSDEETARRAEALHQLGDLRLRRGDVPAAREAFEQSLRLAESLAERAPDDPERLFDLGQSLFWLGHAHEREGNLEEAEPWFRGYLDVSRELAQRHPDHPGARRELAYAYGNLGSVRERQGRLEEARDLFTRSLVLKKAEAEAYPDDAGRRRDLAVSHNKLGVVLQALGELGAAETELRRELALRTELLALRSDHTGWRNDLAVSHNYLGSLLRERGRAGEGLEHSRQAVGLFQELVDLEPTNAVWRYQWAISQVGEGGLMVEAGRREEGVEVLQRAHGLLEDLAASEADFAVAQLGLALSHQKLGQALANREHLLAARGRYEALEAEGRGGTAARWELMKTELTLGDLEWSVGRGEAARAAWERVLELAEDGVGHPPTTMAREAAERLRASFR